MKALILTILEIMAIVLIPYWVGIYVIWKLEWSTGNYIMIWLLGGLSIAIHLFLGTGLYVGIRALWRINKRICKEIDDKEIDKEIGL